MARSLKAGSSPRLLNPRPIFHMRQLKPCRVIMATSHGACRRSQWLRCPGDQVVEFWKRLMGCTSLPCQPPDPFYRIRLFAWVAGGMKAISRAAFPKERVTAPWRRDSERRRGSSQGADSPAGSEVISKEVPKGYGIGSRRKLLHQPSIVWLNGSA